MMVKSPDCRVINSQINALARVWNSGKVYTDKNWLKLSKSEKLEYKCLVFSIASEIS